MSGKNGPVELQNVRITLGQFFTLLGACGVIISFSVLNAYRLTEMEKKVDMLVGAYFPRAQAAEKIAEADSIHTNHNKRLARIEWALWRKVN